MNEEFRYVAATCWALGHKRSNRTIEINPFSVEQTRKEVIVTAELAYGKPWRNLVKECGLVAVRCKIIQANKLPHTAT